MLNEERINELQKFKNFWHKVWHKQKIKEVDESLFNAFIYILFKLIIDVLLLSLKKLLD